MAGKAFTIEPGAELTLSFTVTLKGDLNATEFVNNATVGTIPVGTTIPYGELKVVGSKTVSEPSGDGIVEAGEVLTYTITAENKSPFEVKQVLVKEELGQLVPHIEDTSAVMVTMNRPSGTSTFNLQELKNGKRLDLLAGEVVTFTFKVSVIENFKANLTAKLVNVATVNEVPYPAEIPTGEPKIVSDKIVNDGNGNGFAEAGERLHFTITATNEGNVKAKSVLIKDDLAALLPYITNPRFDGATVVNNGVTTIKTINELMGGFSVDMEAGAQLVITFNVQIVATLDTEVVKSLSNMATIGDGTPEVEIPTASPKLNSSKSVFDANDNKFAEPNEKLDYTITLNNTGKVKAIGVMIKDDLVDLLDHVANPRLSQVTINNNGVVTITNVEDLMDGILVDLEAGKSLTVKFSVVVNGDIDVKEIKVLRNIATVGKDHPEVSINTGDDDLRARKEVVDGNGNRFAEPGETLTYRIIVNNDGNLAANNVQIQDKLEKLLPFILDPTNKDVVVSNGTSFKVSELMAGKSFNIPKESELTLTFSVILKPEFTATLLENDATVGTIPVHTELPYGELIIDALKTVDDSNGNNIAEPGEKLTYRISAENLAEFTAEDIFIQDKLELLLPHIDNPSAVSVTMVNGLTTSTLTIAQLMTGFNVDILSGDTLTLQFTLTVKAGLDTDAILELINIAVVKEELPPVEIPTGAPKLISDKSVSDGNENGFAEKGENLTFAIVTENQGKVAARDILVKDDLSQLLDHIEDPRLLEIEIRNDGVYTFKTVQNLMDGFYVDLEPGATLVVRFSVTVSENLDTDIVKVLSNMATIGDNDPEVEIPTGSPKLNSSKTVHDENDNDYAEPGKTLLYKITVTNSGKVKAEDLFVQDSFSDLLLYVDDPRANLVYVTKLDGLHTYTIQELMDGILLDVEVNETIVAMFSVRIRDDLKVEGVKNLRNVAVVGEETPIVIIDTGDDKLRATKEVIDGNKNGFAESGETLTYTIRVNNDGNLASDPTMIRDSLAKLLLHIEDPRNNVVDINNNGVSSQITVAKLMEGQMFIIGAGKELTLTFTVQLNVEVDASLLENDATVGTIPVHTELPYGEYILNSGKTAHDANGNKLAEPGERIDYTITLSNSGNVKANGINVRDDLKDMIDHIKNPRANAVTVNNDGVITMMTVEDLMEGFNLNLESGKSLSVKFSVVVSDTLDVEKIVKLRNRATVGRETPEVEIPTGAPKLHVEKLVKDHSGDMKAQADEKLTYTLKIRNTGNVQLKAAFVKDSLEFIRDYLVDPLGQKLYISVNGVEREARVSDLVEGMFIDIDPAMEIVLRFEVLLKKNLSKDLKILRNVAEIEDHRPEASIDVLHPVDPRTDEPEPVKPTTPVKVTPGPVLPNTGIQSNFDVSPYLFIAAGLLIVLKTIKKKSDQ